MTDSSKLVLFGKDDKEYTGEDKSNVEAIKKMAPCYLLIPNQ